MPASPNLTERLFGAWLRSHGLFRRSMDTYFQRHDLTGAQWGVLRTLSRAEQENGVTGLAPGELGRRMIVRPPSITGVLNGLVRRNLVERVVSADDLRSKEIRLTNEGRRTLERVLSTHPVQRENIFGPLSPEERRELLQLLEKLEKHLLLSATPAREPLKK